MPPVILWIDGVGGFLVCRSESVRFGPAFAEPAPDIAILADLSRNHATLRREGEGYWLAADRATRVNQSPVERALLRDGDRITLGAACQVQFSQPEPLSASARLTILSGHRFAHPIDAAFLLAETLTLGRSPQAHVSVPDFRERVVVYRQGDDLAVKAASSIRTNGQVHRERAVLSPGVPTLIDDVALTIEPV